MFREFSDREVQAFIMVFSDFLIPSFILRAILFSIFELSHQLVFRLRCTFQYLDVVNYSWGNHLRRVRLGDALFSWTLQ